MQASQLGQLEERRPWVKQGVDPLPGQHLPPRAMPCDGLGTTCLKSLSHMSLLQGEGVREEVEVWVGMLEV